MNILIIYETTEERGHHVDLLDSAALTADLKLGDFHAFIVAASVHQEHHQDAITNFVFAQHKLLNARPSAFISVSLSAALEDENRKRKSTWIALSP